jgi:hypothetical protein
MKLTDTQLVMLSAATQRQDGAVEIDPKLKGSAAQKVLGRLLSEHLIEEIPAQGTLPVWRRDDNKGALALRITERGLAAIGSDQDDTAAKADEADPRSKWRSGGGAGLSGTRVVSVRIASRSERLRSPPTPAPPNRSRRP